MPHILYQVYDHDVFPGLYRQVFYYETARLPRPRRRSGLRLPPGGGDIYLVLEFIFPGYAAKFSLRSPVLTAEEE